MATEQLTWFKDLKPLEATSRCQTDSNQHGVALLKLSSTLSSDLGDYLVLAENAAGEDMTSCNLSLDLEPNVDTRSMVQPEALSYLEQEPEKAKLHEASRLMPPQVIIPLSKVKIEQGSSFRMACKIDGIPKPKVIACERRVLVSGLFKSYCLVRVGLFFPTLSNPFLTRRSNIEI